jgi:hypothetical protein
LRRVFFGYAAKERKAKLRGWRQISVSCPPNGI